MCLCLFAVVGFSFFGCPVTRIEGDGDGTDWDSITGGEDLLKTKRSKGMKIRNGRRSIERMKERSSEDCIFFLRLVRCVEVIKGKKKECR